jgi:hypothetical protein
MNPGETPLDVMRRIYVEFTELEKPVLKEIIFHEEDSRRMRVDVVNSTRETLPSYYQYVLTEEANEFISRHTVPEIIATLLPIVMHPEDGGEAAALLTGILTNYKYRTHEYGRHVSTISHHTSNFLYSTGYRSLSEKGQWSYDSAIAFDFYNKEKIVLARGYLCFKGTNSDRLSDKSKYDQNNLHYQLSQIVDDVWRYESNLRRYQFKRADSLKEWLILNPCPPVLDQEKFEFISERYDKAFLVLGSYPFGLKPDTIIHTMGLKKYWPIIYNKKSFLRDPRVEANFKKEWYEHEKNYMPEVKSTVYKIAMSIYEAKSANKANAADAKNRTAD